MPDLPRPGSGALLSPIAALCLALFLLWCPVLRGQTASAQAPTGTASLSGSVYDAVGGSTLNKAEVRLMRTFTQASADLASRNPAVGGRNSLIVRTDTSGRFHLAGIPAGEYTLHVTRRGYSICGAEVRGIAGRQQGCGIVISIREGQTVSEVQVRLQPAAVVTGQVTDEDGEPMTGVQVEAEQYRYVQGAKTLAVTSRAMTDDRGWYRIYNLSPGRYFVKAQSRGLRPGGQMMPGGPGRMGGTFARPGMQTGGEEDAVSYPVTYYPSGQNAAEAIPLQLAPGAEMGGIDFRLLPVRTYSIQGTVSGLEGDSGGGPRRGLAVIARRNDGTGPITGPAVIASVNPRTGVFTAQGVTPGRYELLARMAGERRGDQVSGSSGRAVVEVGNASVEGVTLVLRQDTVLQGRVILPQGTTGVSLTQIRIMSQPLGAGGIPPVRVDERGEFRIISSAADRVSYAVDNVPEGFYVKSMRLGGVNLLEAGAAMPSEPSGVFEVELASDGGTVSGVARDGNGQPVADARFVLISQSEGQGRKLWSRSVLSGTDGAFTISGVAPGRYRAFVFEDLSDGPALDPDFVAQFGQRWKLVEVKAKDSVTVEAPLIPAAETAMHLGEIAQ